MIGSIIGAAGQIGSMIFGQAKAAKAMRDAKKRIKQQQDDNLAWYKRRYNEDATQSADVRRVLTEMNNAIRNRNRAAAGKAAVMGSSPEAEAMVKNANAEIIGDTTSKIAAQAATKKAGIENAYRTRKQGLEDKLVNLDQQKAAQTTKAAGQAAGAFANIAGAGIDGLFKSGGTRSGGTEQPATATDVTEEDDTWETKDSIYG